MYLQCANERFGLCLFFNKHPKMLLLAETFATIFVLKWHEIQRKLRCSADIIIDGCTIDFDLIYTSCNSSVPL